VREDFLSKDHTVTSEALDHVMSERLV